MREIRIPTRVHVDGHHEVLLARVYVRVPGEEVVEADEVEDRLHPWHEQDERQYRLELAAL